MFFDFLPQNGGACKTDYVEQHDKAIRYLDDSFVPFLLQMKCRNVIFADHGGILLNKTNKLTDLNLLSFTYHPDLTKIPLIVRSPEMKKKENKNIISLMELPEIIECLLNKRAYFPQNKQFVKIQRSTIYNPDFHYLYSKIDCSQALNAFEAFVFEDGFILAIYENGYSELLKDYKVITDSVLKKELEKIVSSHVTVN